MRDIFLLLDGDCFFQLSPKLYNFKFIVIKPGYYFGGLDIIGSILNVQDEYEEGWFFDEWMEDVERLTRQFNVSTGDTKVEMLTLSIKTIWSMKTEFFDSYEKFINLEDKREMINRCHSLKIKATERAEKKFNNADKTKSDDDDDD